MKQKRKSLTRTISAFEAFEFVADEFASAVRFKRSHVDVVDSKSMLTLVIERTRNKGKLVVHYLTNDGTARAGENYVAGSGAVTFYHGEKLAQIKIKLINSDFQPGETFKTFTCVLSQDSVASRGKVKRRPRYTVREPSTSKVRIWDDGEPVEGRKQSMQEIVTYGLSLHRTLDDSGSSVNPFGAPGHTLATRFILCWMYGQTPINSRSDWMTAYDATGLACLTFTAVVTPFQLSFLEERGRFDRSSARFVGVSPLWWVDRVVDIYFFLDLCVSMVRPVMDHQKGIEIIHLQEIRARYFRGPFTIDLFSTIPWDVLAMVVETFPRSLKVVRLLRLLRLFKLARLLRGARALSRWQNRLHIRYHRVEVIRCLLIIAATSHWMSCCWGFLGSLHVDDEPTWYSIMECGGDCFQSEHLVSSPFHRYLSSCYFSVMTLTTVGYGDVHPVNTLEHVVCIIFMICGGVTWAYLVGVVTSVVTNLDPHGLRFRQVMDNINNLIEEQGLPDGLATRARSYWRAAQHLTRTKFYEDHIIRLLSPQLQQEISWYSASGRYSNVNYLSALGDEVLLMLAAATSACKTLYAPGERLYERQTLCVSYISSINIQNTID